MRRIVVLVILGLTVSLPSAAGTNPVALRSLDGSGNNVAHPDWGQMGTQYLRVAAPNYGDGIKTMVSGPAVAVHQQPHLQRRRPESLLREQHLPVGLDVGAVHGPHVRPAARRRASPGRSPSPRPTRSSSSGTTSARSTSSARRPRPGPATRHRASRSTRSAATSTRSASTAGPTRGSNGFAKDPSTGRCRTTARTCCCRVGTCRGSPSAATRHRRPRWT